MTTAPSGQTATSSGPPPIAAITQPALPPDHHHTAVPGLAGPSSTLLMDVTCSLGQFSCSSFGCVDAADVCDGREDCADGSDESLCGSASVTPTPRSWLVPTPGPSLCSHRQLTCGSGECLALERRCDLQSDCSDGSDEQDCVDCVLSSWSSWSECSRSCALGVKFRRRDVTRDRLPGGHCAGAQFDSQSCFIQACPVDGAWSQWGEWSACDAPCQGGVQSRIRKCENPPPKNGGHLCRGESLQTQSCNLQPCGDTQDCGPQMILVEPGDCERRRLDPCPLSCRGLDAEVLCADRCVEGCRCPPTLYLQDGRCVNKSQCDCDVESRRRLPGKIFILGDCSVCLCQDGKVTCNSSACSVDCGWSAWSQWTPCDTRCGAGVQERFRSPTNPASSNGGAPCEGDTREARECYTPCADETKTLWSEWSSWSPCSRTCFYHVENIGVRRRFRHCNSSLTPPEPPCSGESVEEEACDTPLCPVVGGWTAWSGWTDCSARCGSGIQTRNRSCSSPAPLYGGSECRGPQIQTSECNTQPCRDLCPPDMVYQTAEECRSSGGACPRLCLDQAAQVECASACYEGCYCPEGLFLQNNTCVGQVECSCYHQGALYAPGDTVTLDACNNCTCVSGKMSCTAHPCPVDCGWSVWTSWSLCSRTCNVGTRRRYRSETNPPAVFGGHACEGPSIAIEFCSLQPCKGSAGEWGPWSECSVPCGGGYRNRSRVSVILRRIDFSACNPQPCAAEEPGMCPQGKVWKECSDHPSSCADLGDSAHNTECQPGCYCPDAQVLLNNGCVAAERCPCAESGSLYEAGEVVPRGCNNCTCLSGRITNCSQLLCDADWSWSDWTPWSECSAVCGGGFQSRYRFCLDPPPPGSAPHCATPQHEERPCNLDPCSENGSWSVWSSWTDCTKSCGEGVRSRTRRCNNPLPLGGGDYCEGRSTEVESCQPALCPAMNCSAVAGSVYSSCGPACPRSCDDITLRQLCRDMCQPGCSCPPGGLLAEDGSACVAAENCTCLDIQTGERRLPGETGPRGDGCNNCSCVNGLLECSSHVCAVAGGWCEWSVWTPCSRTCGTEMVTRYRSCACPKPRGGGAACDGVQQYHGDTGVQLERQQCPSPSFCPVDGLWGPWSHWARCDGCSGDSVRARQCDSPPARFGGAPCEGESRQSRICHENSTRCSECGGGLVDFECGKPCPRSCDDLGGDSLCLEAAGCRDSCGCPEPQLMQDGACVAPSECRCKHQNQSLGVSERGISAEWSGPVAWHYVQPGESVSDVCQNCTCLSGRLFCTPDPDCVLDGGWDLWTMWSPCSSSCGDGVQTRTRKCDRPAPQNGGRDCAGGEEQRRDCRGPACPEPDPWGEWSPWSACSFSCGGGEQIRVRECRHQDCDGNGVQSRMCNNQVCLDVGCPIDRLYRECGKEDSCPYSCAHLSQQVECFPDDCEEGCHCPRGTYFHNGSCITDCPCLVTEETLQELRSHQTEERLALQGAVVLPGEEVPSGEEIRLGCSFCACRSGRLNCTFSACPQHGGFTAWSPWGPCSVSCGGLGNMTRSRDCSNPAPANGGRDCEGPSLDIRYCQTPECADAAVTSPESDTNITGPEEDFSSWTPWTPCSKSCSDRQFPAVKTRSRLCPAGRRCIGESFQEGVCNLPQCSGADVVRCVGTECAEQNCWWNEWTEWSECSRSCGVGQQRRLRTYNPPGERGLWCEDILTGNMERRFCSLQACRGNGAWSRWSPWSWCDRTCGGGRSVRSRTCSSPPPKNGGKDCSGEKHQVRICNAEACAAGCPAGMQEVPCANRCPRRCSDFQQGIVCLDGETCEPGCRCPAGTLEQDGGCVPVAGCDCTDSRGKSWVAQSSLQEDCNNCTCADGRLSCTNHTCPSLECNWSQWSTWSQCSASCGSGLQTRFRSPTSGSEVRECRAPESRSRPCYLQQCPELCLRRGSDQRIGEVWLEGECQQCICTPEGNYCQDIDCRVNGNWTPWSPWSDCPVTCGAALQIRTRACIDPPPRNNGSYCPGPDSERRNCTRRPCEGSGRCGWAEWSPCSRSCSVGIRRRTWRCDRTEHVQSEACYLRPCDGRCSWGQWSDWSECQCHAPFQYRYREPQGPNFGGEACEETAEEVRSCDGSRCSESSCRPPFVFSLCGSPCDGLCLSASAPQICPNASACQPGCYCPPGLLQQNGECVPPAQCGCQAGVHFLVPGAALRLGCRECVCQQGALRCNSSSCAAVLSEWSEWSSCSPCVPSAHNDSTPPSFLSIQRRHRICLSARTGFPWSGEPPPCSGELSEDRICPGEGTCEDLCVWREWGEWGTCREPCSGGVRYRWRHVHHPIDSELCQGARSQSDSCNTAVCPGEDCEERGRAIMMSCANRCPRSCADLWEHVECLQGECRTGCRCPEGRLLQDQRCVPIAECRCGLPTANRTSEYQAGEALRIGCNNCTCVNGGFSCTQLLCPLYGSWSDWGPCSASCAGGHRWRSRSCAQRGREGAPCGEETQEMEECNSQPCLASCELSDWSAWSTCSASCGGGVSERKRSVQVAADPGEEPCPSLLVLRRTCNSHNCTSVCPEGQVYSDCANACPLTCADLRPETACINETCQAGCGCPPGQVVQDGGCVTPEGCMCVLHPWTTNLTLEESERRHPPGTVIFHQCNNCTCHMGAFLCSALDCNVDCRWSHWSDWSPCSVTCGSGIQTSQRHHLQQRLYDGEECAGPPTRHRSCHLPECSCPEGERWRRHSAEHCERTCQEVYGEPRRNCSHGPHRGCQCEEGMYRSRAGPCVSPAHCECEHGGHLYQAGESWREGCDICRCVNGIGVCDPECPALQCAEGEVKVQEPGQCCPVCRRQLQDERWPSCLLHTEVRNISKGGCWLDEVKVSFCRGRCLSWTHVLTEEPYLQTVCECCSYRLDPDTPVMILRLQCDDGEEEPVVLPVIRSCECSSCQGGDFSRR